MPPSVQPESDDVDITAAQASHVDIPEDTYVEIKLAALLTELADVPFLRVDRAVAKRFLVEHSSIEQAKSKYVAAHNWRSTHGVDSLLSTWLGHAGLKESTVRSYWPGTILHGRAHDGSVVQLNRLRNVDFAGLAKLDLIGTAVLHSTYLNELSLHLDPAGRQVMLFDCGASDSEFEAGQAISDLDLRAIIAFLRAMSTVMMNNYPNVWSRIVLIRAPSMLMTLWQAMIAFSTWWRDQLLLVDIYSDVPLPALLEVMPMETLPEYLGGGGSVEMGQGGYLVAPPVRCELHLPWQPKRARVEPPIWTLEVNDSATPRSVCGGSAEAAQGSTSATMIVNHVANANVPNEAPSGFSTPPKEQGDDVSAAQDEDGDFDAICARWLDNLETSD